VLRAVEDALVAGDVHRARPLNALARVSSRKRLFVPPRRTVHLDRPTDELAADRAAPQPVTNRNPPPATLLSMIERAREALGRGDHELADRLMAEALVQCGGPQGQGGSDG
jgi:hypothetical protein